MTKDKEVYMDEAVAQMIIRGEHPACVNKDAIIMYWIKKAFRIGYKMAYAEMYDLNKEKEHYWR